MASEIKVDTIVNAGGDNDSGIDLSTNDNIKFNIAGSQKAIIDSNGNVGIGESSLTGGNTILDLHHSGSGVGTNIAFANDHNTDKFFVGVSGDTNGDALIFNAENSNVIFGTNNSEKMRIKSSEVVINEDGADLDFRVEADANENCFKVDAGGDSGRGVVLFNQSQASVTSNGAYFSLGDTIAHLVLANTHTSGNLANLFCNREGSDGTFIEFRQANSAEGTITVSGSTVSYNGFSGLHESSGIPTNTPIGTVVSTIDELDVYSAKQNSESGGEEDNPKAGKIRADHAKVKISDTAGDKAVYGVVGSFNEQGKVNVASVGIGSVRVTGACAKGDLLESNGDGTAKVQSDDIVRSKTIGKVTIGNSSTDVKLVSCVLYCG